MVVQRSLFGPWRAAMAATGVFALIGATAPHASAAPPRYPDILPLSKIKPGMVGYGLTTFKGTTISRFKVTVIGVMRKANGGHDLILVRMKGGPITERGANLIHGMSGSPIYFDGKVAGAFAMGEPFPREPIGMVTPIEDMLEAWDPNIPQQPSYYLPAEKLPTAPSEGGAAARRVSELYRVHSATDSRSATTTINLSHPLTVGNRHIVRLVLNARPNDPRRSTEDTAVLHPATQLLSVSGIDARDRDWFQKELDKRGYALTVVGAPGMAARGGQTGAFKGAPLRPGSAFGTWLATGDVQVGGTGTVTYRRGNRILGFGHPLMSLGALNAAVSSAYVLDIFPGLDTSHHIAEPGPVVGTLRQDRDFSVSAELGAMPNMIPFEVTVRDHTTLRTQTFHASVFQHPDITPLLLRLVAKNVVTQVHDIPGDAMARVTTTVEAGEVGKVTRTNVTFDAADIASTATADLNDITNVISGNPFYPLPIKSAHMTVDISSGHDTATVERIFLKQGKYEPGDNLDIGVVLKPYRREPVVRNVSLKIPADTPSGRYALVVRGGMAPMSRIGSFLLQGGSSDPQTPPVNVRQMIAHLNAHEENTDIVTRLVLNSAAPALEGEKLSQLPPNLATLMRSDRNSGVRLERDEIRTVVPGDYVVSGMQQLVVTIQRKNTQEPTGGGNFGGSQPSVAPTSRSPFEGNGNGLSSASANDDDMPINEIAGQPALQLNGAAERWIKYGRLQPAQSADDDVTGADAGSPDQDTKPTAPSTGNKPGKAVKPDTKAVKSPAPARQESADASTTSVTVTTAPPASAQDTGNDRPVGRQLQTWRQSAALDFGAGKFSGVAVAANGELRLAPRLRRLASSGETYVWALVTDTQGNIYAGTGTGGKILKVDPQGNVTTFATLPVISIQSLLMGHDGTLWAGSGLKGNLYRVGTNGAVTLAASLPEKYILALAEDSKGNLYIAPGGGGNIYRMSTTPSSHPVTPDVYLKTSADHVMSLTVDRHDNLYAGTGNDGILYKVTPDGKSSVLYDARENSITALACDANGNVYAGTGPRGLLYRITPDGAATVLYDHATSFYTALRVAANGTLYASTVNAIYHIHPAADHTAGIVHPLDNPKEVDFLTVGILPNGGVVAGTGNVGEIYTSVPDKTGADPNFGAFESVVHDAHNLSRWGALHMVGTFNAASSGTAIHAETRSGNVAEPDSTWSGWTPVVLHGNNEINGMIASPPARFIQYRLTLNGVADGDHAAPNAEDASPTVRSVSISYMPRNQAPRVAFQSPAGDERWAKTQTIRWSGNDPDNDTLTYELFYSADGVTWQPLPAGGRLRSLASAAQKPDAQSAIPAPLKRQFEAAGGNGALRATSKSWDTTGVPDGAYRLKIVASDRASNPVDFQTAEAVSEPFIICNTPPTLALPVQPNVGADHTVTLTGTALQQLIAITAVQYRIDGGDWIAAVPKDGLFDSPQENFTVSTLPLPSGKHTLEVAAFNAAGIKSVQKVDIVVP